jgi:glycosyltransferase involved in cell wall biosynthesis
MRVLVLNYEFPPLGGGAGRVTLEVCRRLARAGVEQKVLTGWFPGLALREKLEPGLWVYRVPTLRRRLYRAEIKDMASYLAAAVLPLLWLSLRWRPDLLHAHFLMPVAPLAWLAGKLLGIPYLVTLHGGDVPGADPITKPVYRLLGGFPREVACGAFRLTAVSPGTRTLARKSLGINARFIPNGVDLKQCRPRGKTSGGPLRLAFAGRLVSLKNADLLIRAVELLPPDLSWRLDIYGDGPDQRALASLAARSAQSDRITLHGWIEEARLRDALAASDIFILPSDSEGFSMAALQAMACGCALILSDIPANRPLVKPGENGLLCRRSAEGLAQAIMFCLPELSRMQQASARLASGYSWEKISLNYLDLYGQALAGHA